MIRAKILHGLVIGAIAALLILGVDAALTVATAGGVQPLQAIELRTYDWRLQHTAKPQTAVPNIALVEIDESSLRNLEPVVGKWPWPRVLHGELYDFLARGPAKVVAVDVNFAGPDHNAGFKMGDGTMTGAESDQALADSIKRAGNVILLSDATFAGEASAPPLPDFGYSQMNVPGVTERSIVFSPYAAAAKAAMALGHNLFVLDPDGPIRHTVPFVRSNGHAIPSLGLAAALKVYGVAPGDIRLDGQILRAGDRAMPLEWRHVQTQTGTDSYLWGLINFHGPALLEDMKHHVYPTYSFFDLFYSEEQILAGQKPDVDPAIFKDKIVFVGATGAGLFDVFETPFSHGRMPGIQIHAAVADDLLTGRFMRAGSTTVRIATVVATSLAAGVLSTLLPAWWATGATLALIVLFGWLSTALFAGGYWLNLSQPILADSFALFGGVGYQYFVEGREKRKMKKLFGQYVSKDVYEQLVANPGLARLGGNRRQMSVLFSDIRGFTTFSEKGQPEDVVHMLNEYFTKMVAIVFHHKGTVDKFVGDMVMALFGAPLDDPEHAEHAVETALEMIAELKKLNEKWAGEGRPSLDIGVGVNTGPMIAGNIGSDQIMSYTVIGDAVNLGSRLESLNKQYSTRIIISEATKDCLKGVYTFRSLGDVVVKGKSKPVAIFEVLGRGEGAEALDPRAQPSTTAGPAGITSEAHV
ncbi:MAG TPA: adenylate/guanylate cyclase domain-containing protein [Vicinamibacterales bacterium]|nr:adenylate/guanylate cyclase domain-containing protein [Vicinamibacterales bacterium]